MDGGGSLSLAMAWPKQFPSEDQHLFALVSGSDDI